MGRGWEGAPSPVDTWGCSLVLRMAVHVYLAPAPHLEGIVGKSPSLGLFTLGKVSSDFSCVLCPLSALGLLECGGLGVMTPGVPKAPDVGASAQPVSACRVTPVQP